MSDIVRQQLRCCLHTPLRTTEVQPTLSKQQEKLLVLKILKLSASKRRINNQPDASGSNIPNLFCHETLHVSGISVSIIRSYQLYTWQLVWFMQVMWSLPRRVRFQLPSAQLIIPDDDHRRWPKRVEFRDKINFGYLMYVVCYLYEAYHYGSDLYDRKL